MVALTIAIAIQAADTAPNELTTERGEKLGTEGTPSLPMGSDWRLLFNGKSTQGWRSFKKKSFPTNGWVVEDGWLHCQGKGGGDVITDSEFNDFELQWEWKQAPGGNSGVKYFITEARSSAIGHEYQMIDEQHEPDAKQHGGKRVSAAFYDVLKPSAIRTKPSGETNQSRIVVTGNHVEHWLNGAKVLEYSCGSEELKAAIAQSKFRDTADFGNKIKGHILLQDHHSEVWFRNVKIRQPRSLPSVPPEQTKP